MEPGVPLRRLTPVMGRKLWFIGNGEEPVDAFPSRRAARFELEALEREDPAEIVDYEIYGIEIDDLEDHPDELEIAEREGLV